MTFSKRYKTLSSRSVVHKFWQQDADQVIIVRLRDLEKTCVHVKKKCYQQPRVAGRLASRHLPAQS